uniref:C-type lectin domain-containing protein n=1 Tax=Chelydra serpentina TaxID=8475 RepID=A0A8C3RP34_CHESE
MWNYTIWFLTCCLLKTCSTLCLCSQGWLAFKGSCYKMSKSSKPWSTAQQICELFSIGAHLVDIQNEEEHIFISSYLQTVNQIIMLWTGLNDLKVRDSQEDIVPQEPIPDFTVSPERSGTGLRELSQ